MRGIYVFHYWKPNRFHIHKVGMAENIGRRKGDYSTTNFEPEFSRIYEINDGYDLLKIEEAIHTRLEKMGVKVGPEWFEIEVQQIDQCAIQLFDDNTGLFAGAMKTLHLVDPTEIERVDYGHSASTPSKRAEVDEGNQLDAVRCQPVLTGFTPRDDQVELLCKLKQHFMLDGNTRGQIRLPPGYGKTQIGCCLFPVQNGMKRILILVPSIKLAKETAVRVKTFHKNNLNIDCFKYFEVHSDGGICTVAEINSCEYVCVIGVYNSVAKLHEAKPFDIIIFDEAHRTSIKSKGLNNHESDEEEAEACNETHFTYALSDDNIVAKYRLFMTATPRIISNDENSMSNLDKYGEVIYSMTIREAVKKHIINDYKIWMYVKAHNEVLSVETDGERFALLMKFLEQSQGTKTLIVCRSIKSCDFVSSRLKTRGFGNIFAVHSQMNKKEVDRQVDLFKSTKDKSCLCAVNMFKEGIDCPAIDSVVFYDERSSVIDVLQIVGRGLRYKPNLDYTDIGVLCSVNPSERLDEQCEMRYLRMIIQNMFDYNEEITNNLQIFKEDTPKLDGVDEMVNKVRNEMKDNEDTQRFEADLVVHSDVQNYGEKNFKQARDFAHERSALYRWRIPEDWFDYISRAELPRDIPRRPDRVYKTMGWISWDDFLGLDPDKPFDLSTFKYILQKDLKNGNPTEDEYNAVIEKYGSSKVVNPSQCNRIYGKSLYEILETVFGSLEFMQLQEFKRLKTAYAIRGRFGIDEYKTMKNDLSLPKPLPSFPLVYYNVASFSRL